MKCRFCGHEIPEGILYCKICGKEVRIVPDYNPLDEILTAQIKGSINGQEYERDYLDYDSSDMNTGYTSARRNTGRTAGGRTNTGRTARMNTGRNGAGRNTSGRPMSSKEQRKRKAEREKALRKKRRRFVLLILLVLIAAIGGICFAVYSNSYTGVVRRANKALQNQEYSKAEELFKKAISKKDAKAEAYAGLSQVYIRQDNISKGEDVFLDAIDKHRKNAEIYEAFIKFYLNTEQPMEIPELLDEADDSVRGELAGYIIDTPKYSLDENETYDDVQQLALSGKNVTIYYTTDGSEPTLESDKYTEPIQLDEGDTTVKAIAVDKRGVPSMSAVKEYTIEFPIEDAPAVSPSTGQYATATNIEIKVPEGYEAYYTMSGDDPTTSSDKYTGPIAMPEGETLFKAVLVNKKGRMSGVTTRNYVLDTSGGADSSASDSTSDSSSDADSDPSADFSS